MWLLLAVAAVAAVQGAQYGDYGAVKMPAYGEYEAPRDPPRDYRLPSVPASPDYKDEVEIKVTQKSLGKDYRNGDSWQRALRKQAKRGRNDEDYPDVSDSRIRDIGDRKFREDQDRSQLKDDKTRDIRSRVKHKRDQHEDRDDEEFSIEKYIRGINENNMEADVIHGRKTTDKIIRRKARDRDLGKVEAAFKEDDFDEELKSDKVRYRAPSPLQEIEGPLDDLPSDRDDVKLRSGSDDVVPLRGGRRQGDAGTRRRGYDDEPPRLRPAQRARLEPGAASGSDYDYYDVKRLQNKKKMSGNKKRPEASEDDWSPAEIQKLRELENRRLMKVAGRRSSTRRATSHQPTTLETITTTTTTTTISSTATTTVITTSSEPSLTTPKSDKNELSLAEKSRLSIMRKAGLKERQKGGTPTTKPPVLLQVTKQMPTVILVEASTSADPWIHAREIQADSSENLAKVRQLMRSKLVANAKDIRDLTEDWDQLVCDYVDVAMLKKNAHPLAPNLVHIMVTTCSLSGFIF